MNPKAAVIDGFRYVTAGRLEMKASIREELYEKIKRACDVLAHKKSRHVSLEEVLEAITDEYLCRHDPIQKADRAVAREEKNTPVARELTPRMNLWL